MAKFKAQLAAGCSKEESNAAAHVGSRGLDIYDSNQGE